MRINDREIEKYKRILADVTTVYECLNKSIRETDHDAALKMLCQALYPIISAKNDIEEHLKFLEGK